jgi:uncharacterized Rossmann fold enzyme
MTTATKEPQILDASVSQPTRYCVPFFIRDEQIKVNIEKVKGRIEGWEGDAPRPGPVAIACFGPSLNDTWEQLRGFETIISCSGAHKFLIERNIVPRYHVEVDPRAHKVKLIGEPHPDVEYLIASTCHPSVLDHLAGFNVKLWHVFDNQEDAKRTLPHGEWALTGGSSVGLRAMTIARFLGFVDLHVFGMDGCEGQTGKHAAEHPSQPKGHAITVYDGVTYKTTASMLECARQTWHELDQMPGVTAKFYGEGLVQHMAQHYVPKPIPIDQAAIGSLKPRLISAEYVALNAQLHKDNLAYGVGGGKHADTVLKLVAGLQKPGQPPVSVLDYGCGKSYLQKALPFPIFEYDPAIPGKQESPRAADLVVATDVLEHIEPPLLPFVLDDLRRCVKQIGYFTISTRAAVKVLADGRNAHLIQEGKQWWRTTLQQFFMVGKIIEKGSQLHVIVAPKGKA